MRGPLGKALRKEFARRLGDAWPWFRPAKGMEIPSGDSLFSWQAGPNLTFFVLLEPHSKEDWFNVSVAWSEKNRWPAYLGWMSASDTPKEGEKRFRLSDLWSSERIEPWWELVPRAATPEMILEMVLNPPPVEEALDRIAPLVDDVAGHLVREGGEYFRRIAAEHGYEWPASASKSLG